MRLTRQNREKPTLRRGARGGAVEELQHALLAAGFDAHEASGQFGAKTEEAVRAFQQARGLVADGIVSFETWTSLAVAPPYRPGILIPTSPRSRRSLSRSIPGALCSTRPAQQFQPPLEATLFQPRLATEAGPAVQAGRIAEQRPGPASPQSQRLADMGIEVVPLTSVDCGGTQGYPPGVDPTSVLNYEEIADAFSHIPYPGIWATLNIADPFPSDVYYDNLFKRVSNPFRVIVAKSGEITIGCGGDTGQTNGTEIDLCDCSDKTVVMHEMGHVIQHRGIEAGIAPLYYSGAPPTPPGVGTNQPTLDATAFLYQIFGDFSEQRRDGGIKVGFATNYSETNVAENFAEHFMFYSYFGSSFRAKMARQEQEYNSVLLTRKYFYISRLFLNLWFDDGGGIGGWPGYRI
jgi:Putative peptidoglycan binding domain